MAGGTCPQGHTSTWDDFCSVCGDSMDPAVTGEDAGTSGSGGTPASAIAGECTNCQTPFGVDDVFCESCGYDFATGTLPGALAPQPTAPTPDGSDSASAAGGAASASSAATPSMPSTPSAASTGTAMVAVIACDRGYFDEIVGEADLAYPDPEPEPTTVSLTGGKILIGRHNQSRGVYPEIDVDACTGDPAASTRHAMLRRTADGQWTINDLGSTNGTMLMAAPESDGAGENGTTTETPESMRTLIAPGTELEISAGATIYIGAFTRITLQAAEAATV